MLRRLTVCRFMSLSECARQSRDPIFEAASHVAVPRHSPCGAVASRTTRTGGVEISAGFFDKVGPCDAGRASGQEGGTAHQRHAKRD